MSDYRGVGLERFHCIGIVCSYTVSTHCLGGWWASMIAGLAQSKQLFFQLRFFSGSNSISTGLIQFQTILRKWPYNV